MKRFSCLALLALAQSQAGAAQDSNVRVETPSSGWLLDYADDRCRIIRTFGEGASKTLLFLEQVEPSSKLSWILAGPVVSDIPLRKSATIRFGPAGNPQTVDQIGSTFPEYGQALTGTGLTGTPTGEGAAASGDALVETSAQGALSTATTKGKSASGSSAIEMPSSRVLDPSEAEGLQWLDVTTPDGATTRFDTGDMKPVYEAMNTCMDNLLAHWGLDPSQERRRTAGPESFDMSKAARRIIENYPFRGLRKGKSAIIQARMIIGADGSVTDCKIVNLTDAEEFGAGVCRIIRESARFKPALDANGVPMKSYLTQEIRYQVS